MAKSNNKTERVMKVLTDGPASVAVQTENAFNLEVETQEILNLQAVAGNAVIEIGRRLIHVKENLDHGEWLNWLAESINYSERTAQRLMRLAREDINPALVSDLGARKALALLALPPEERETFAVEVNASEISAKELEQAIRERDEAVKARDAVQVERDDVKADLEKANAKSADLSKQLETVDIENDKLREEIETVKAQIKELKSRPIEIATETVTVRDEKAIKDAVDAARMEEQDKAEKTEKALKNDLREAKDDLQETRDALQSAQDDAQSKADENKTLKENLEKARQELAEAREQAKKAAAPISESESDLAKFAVLYAQVQESVKAMRGILANIEQRGDTDNAGKLKTALSALVKRIGGDAK